MSTQIADYKCPACTGPLHFVGESGKLECDYCGSKFEVAKIEALYARQTEKATEAFEPQAASAPTSETTVDVSQTAEQWSENAEGLRVYSCPSCGAELVTDETTAATSCPYCGNNTIVPGQFAGVLKPDFIVPFKLNKEDAKQALKKHYRNKIFLPSAFSNANHIEELKGIYIPFWLFDTTTDADCVFHGTRSHTHRHGDYQITETEHYRIRRAGTMEFRGTPADGSKKMPDDYMDSIEPFNYDEMKPFSAAYLPGYLADKYDVTADDNLSRVDRRCRASAIKVARDSITGYQTLVPENSNIQLHHTKIQYALMPVWTLHTKWNRTDYLFMMNGQTGKMVGDLPVSRAKFLGVFAILAVVFSNLSFWLGIGRWIAALIIA